MVVTRFAPSPTGFLHIGGARTALFNWLFARHHKGKFLLRIEDTDRERSTQEAIDAILDSLKWLELDWEEPIIYQSKKAHRHQEVAQQLLDKGHAYKCYCTPEEVEQMRAQARKKGLPPRYDGTCRNREPDDTREGLNPVVRFKMPQEGALTLADRVQGEVTVDNRQLDDLILLRGDGSPTYMLSVVVDDFDMGITHIIRGDDHLTNSFRQAHLYQAMGWTLPTFVHLPLIHGADGAKLSKRHGALGADAYREMGYLAAAVNNYLLRLGWGHGDDEIISRAQAIEWFDVGGIGKSAARFDLEKLTHLNGHYIRETADAALVKLIQPLIEKNHGQGLGASTLSLLERGMNGLKQRAKTLVELADNAMIYVHTAPLPFEEKAQALLGEEARALLKPVPGCLEGVESWTHDGLEEALRAHATAQDIKFGKIAQPLRAALTGRAISPGIFEVMEVLGPEETLNRLKAILS